MNTKLLATIAVNLAALILTPLSARAVRTTILQPTSVNPSSEALDFNEEDFVANNLINQSGLSQSYTSGITDYNTFTSTATHVSYNDGNTVPAVGVWSTSEGTTIGTLNFDLGGVVTIQGLALWNYEQDSEGINTFELFADTDNDFQNGLGISLGAFNAIEGSAPITAQTFAFPSVSTR